MNILVTGGLGYIGSHVAVSFFEAGASVVVYDNKTAGIHNLKGLEELSRGAIKVVFGDVNDVATLSDVLVDSSISLVVHCAGLKVVNESIDDPLTYYLNNSGGTLAVLTAMLRSSVKKIIFSSTAAVYGEPEYLPIDEVHRLDPMTPYAKSKLFSEWVLNDYFDANPSFTVVILRFFNPLGAHDSGYLSEGVVDEPDNILPYVMNVASGRCSVFNVFGDNFETRDGTGVRDYVHVLDLAQAHLCAASLCGEGSYVFNVGSNRGFSVYEVLNGFRETVGVDIPFRVCGRRGNDVSACYASNKKARQVLNWKPERSLADMLMSAWNAHLRRFDGHF